jgi:hypothetical protein
MTDATTLDPAQLAAIVAEQPYPLSFATVSGAHLYGFPSRDSDVDLRGVHLLPVAEVVGLRHGPATLDRTWHRSGLEIDLVAHLPTLIGGRPELSYLADLVAAKVDAEHGTASAVPGMSAIEQVAADVARLHAALEDARERSSLPEQPSASAALHDLVVRVRLNPALSGPDPTPAVGRHT